MKRKQTTIPDMSSSSASSSRPRLQLTPATKKEWTPGTYTPQYSDRPDGNYTSQIPASLNGCAHCVLPPSKDRGGLYLGSEDGGQQSNLSALQDLHVGLIINATPRYPNYHQNDIPYIRVNVNDEPSATVLPWFDGIAERIQCTLESNKSVFVHCQMGISRSSTLVMAYLMRYQQATRNLAYRQTKERRPKVEPNIGFWAQLLEYEDILRTRNSANGNGETKRKDATPTAVVSMCSFLMNPTSFHELYQTTIDFQCLHRNQHDAIYEAIAIDDAMAIDAALLTSLNYVYDTPSEDRLEWFKQFVKLTKKENAICEKLEQESDFMNDFWSGEFNESKVTKILNAIK